MKIYTRISWDMATGQITESESYEYTGPVAECKGDQAIKNAEQSQANFNNTLQGIFQTQFGKQSDILATLTGKLTPMLTNPTGFSPEALAAMRSRAADVTSSQYQSGLKAVLSGQAERGDLTSPVMSGVNKQLAAQMSAAESGTLATQLGDIELQNENQKNANYWRAVEGLSGVSAAESPTSYGSLFNQGGQDVASLGEAYKKSQESQLMSTLGGIAGGASSAFATGGLSTLVKSKPAAGGS